MYEHQSTISPNIPERFLQYVSREYSKMIARKSTYSPKKLELPEPHFVVLYNGTQEDVSSEMIYLSDLYPNLKGHPNLDLCVKKININLGKNDDLLHNCKPLEDYVLYVTRVRFYVRTMDIRLAVERAVNECIKEGILTEFLIKFKAEAIEMSIFEYDEERELQVLREDIREMALEEGLEQGLEKGCKTGLQEGLQNAVNMFIQYNFEKGVLYEDIVATVHEVFHLPIETAKTMVTGCI